VRAAENEIELIVRIADSVPRRVVSDSKRVRQILFNLIGNAIKFTRVGRVELSVDYHDGRLVMDVIDSGIGMSATQVSQLFKPFHQADNSISREFGGSGLGLVISQRLAHMLEGEISVQSELGKGSTFTFSLPVVIADDQDLPETVRDSVQNTAVHSNGKVSLNCSVLVVDDRRDIRFLSGRILSQAGADVAFAENGLQAIDLVQRQLADGASPDIILLDMQMPIVDGHEAASRLRKLGYSNPIVALTADAMYGDMERCLESGCTCYLGKPINSAELLNCVAGLTAR
jgi:CheY-like chemotaxis protein